MIAHHLVLTTLALGACSHEPTTPPAESVPSPPAARPPPATAERGPATAAEDPEPEEGTFLCDTEISWDEAVGLLDAGRVREVFQFHSLDVVFTLEDGCEVTTVEPQIDAIFDLVRKRKCASPRCPPPIRVSTE